MYKNIFHFIVLTIAFATIASCTSKASNQQQRGMNIQDKNNVRTKGGIAKNGEDDLKYYFYKDPKNGMVETKAPLPASWMVNKNTDGEISINGFHGIKVNKSRTENYVYATNWFALQTLQQMGKQISPVVSLQTIIQQHIKPYAESQGYSFIKSYPLPGVVKFWEMFSAGMLQTGSRKQYRVVGTEWKDNDGNKSFTVIVQSISQKNAIIIWSVQTTELEAPVCYFENAKKAYVDYLAQTEINPQWQQMMNGKLMGQIRRNDTFWVAKSRVSTQAHQQRMAAITARGNASRSVAKTYSEISDISHAGYFKRSNINNAGHAKTINMIAGHTVIGNQDTGESYTVDSGSKYYWVNNQGEYFGTDNALYDPRIDNKINDTQWTKFKVKNK